MYGSARLMRTIYSQSVLILKIVRYNPCGLCCYRYAEYQYVCSTDQIEAKQCFGDIDMFQLFDLVPEHSYLPRFAFMLLCLKVLAFNLLSRLVLFLILYLGYACS
eukprot:COSAG02_NODE_8931_length_2395_cov_2.478223_2_plen_105_part_00